MTNTIDKQNRRAVIFANGELPDLERLRAWLLPTDVLVAADGGLHHIFALGLKPQVLIGDFDSISSVDLGVAAADGARVLQYPAEKDETDLELALNYTVAAGYRQVRIVAALGGRLDQTLGNLFMLARPQFADLDMRLDDGCEEAWLAQAETEITGQPGDRVSLLPLSPQVQGVVTQGLRYPLHAETLHLHHTRGISNEMEGNRASVVLTSGTLIVIHTRLQGV